LSQLKALFPNIPTASHLPLVEQPLMFVLLIGIAVLMLGFPAIARRFPPHGRSPKCRRSSWPLRAGLPAYYLLKAIDQDLNLGTTVGDLRMSFARRCST
jgi:hypothetical protein